ncbi:Acetyl-coenzyme A carboxylase carboxyl transferase subunit alpha [Nymphon striatum]|nr:Acetyl-coenzyme A carboxylase carboxyl transferase subunit alpha [Nymphon striatum]
MLLLFIPIGIMAHLAEQISKIQDNDAPTAERFKEDDVLDFKISASSIRWMEKDSLYRLTSYRKRKIIGDTAIVETKRRLDTLFTFKIDDLTPVSYVAETKNLLELNSFIEDQRQKGASNINAYVLVKYKRWALPFSVFILTIIAVGVASIKRRGGMGLNLLIGIVLEDQLDKCMIIGEESEVDVTETCKQIEKKLSETRKDIYKILRLGNEPYTLDYINAICGETFLELHGDRNVKDDKAMIGGLGKIKDQTKKAIIQKLVSIVISVWRTLRVIEKALRLMKSAEKFGVPVVCLIDTPGAYPGIEAEERGQGEAIARNILEMTRLKVPIICVIIGEGASGGALGIGVGDRVLMLENTWYSVISPESCSSILWRSWEYKELAAEALKAYGY